MFPVSQMIATLAGLNHSVTIAPLFVVAFPTAIKSKPLNSSCLHKCGPDTPVTAQLLFTDPHLFSLS
jgi:hypothetical protein